MQGQALAIIAAAVVSLAALPAAASTATASMTDFHVELIDLDPNDGITPSLTFQNLQGGSFIAAESGVPGHVHREALVGLDLLRRRLLLEQANGLGELLQAALAQLLRAAVRAGIGLRA